MSAGLPEAGTTAFTASDVLFATVRDWLGSSEATALEHAELEDQLDTKGRELMRQLLQDHLDLRAQRETRVQVRDAAGMTHGAVEAGHARDLSTVFGQVEVTRLAYRRAGIPTCTPPTRC